MSDSRRAIGLARMLLEASRRGVGQRAAVWAALIAERDILRRPLAQRYRTPAELAWPSDVAVRERALATAREARFDVKRCTDLGLNAGACRDVDRAARQYGAIVDRLSAGGATPPSPTGGPRPRHRGRRRPGAGCGGGPRGRSATC